MILMLNLKRSVLLIFLLSVILLIACTTAQPTPVSQSRPTVQETNTPAAIPTDTADPSPLPEIQISPTETSEPTLPPTRTNAPTPTVTLTPLPTSTPTHQILEEFVSPSGIWIATVEKQFVMKGQNGDVNDIFLRVRNVEEDIEWIVENYRADDWISNAALPRPLHWTENAQYLFFTHTVLSDGCYPTGPFSDLLQFDLSTGQTIELFPSIEAYDYIVAPDGDKMAVIFRDGFIRIYEFVSGNARDVSFHFDPEPDDVYMELFWSPNSQMMMIQVRTAVCEIPPPPGTSLIYRINGTTLEKTLLHVNDETDIHEYSVTGWPEADLVLLFKGGATYYMNPWTGEVSTES